MNSFRLHQHIKTTFVAVTVFPYYNEITFVEDFLKPKIFL